MESMRYVKELMGLWMLHANAILVGLAQIVRLGVQLAETIWNAQEMETAFFSPSPCLQRNASAEIFGEVKYVNSVPYTPAVQTLLDLMQTAPSVNAATAGKDCTAICVVSNV